MEHKLMATESIKTKGVPRYKAWEGVALFKQGFKALFSCSGPQCPRPRHELGNIPTRLHRRIFEF